MVEWATTESFADARAVRGPAALEDSDFTAKLDLAGLPPGQKIYYRMRFVDLADHELASEPVAGSFRTPPAAGATSGSSGPANRRAGLGHQPRLGRHDDLRGDAAARAGLLHPLRRHDLRRRADRGREVSCRTAASGGTSPPRRSPRSPRRWPSSAATTPTTCWTRTSAASTPRCRCSPSGTTTRSSTTGIRARSACDQDERYREKSVALLAARGLRAFSEYLPVRRHPLERGPASTAASATAPRSTCSGIDMRTYRGPNTDERQAEPGPDDGDPRAPSRCAG